MDFQALFVTCMFSPAVRRPGPVAEYSRLYNAKFKDEWSCMSTPPLGFNAVQKDNFTFTCTSDDI